MSGTAFIAATSTPASKRERTRDFKCALRILASHLACWKASGSSGQLEVRGTATCGARKDAVDLLVMCGRSGASSAERLDAGQQHAIRHRRVASSVSRDFDTSSDQSHISDQKNCRGPAREWRSNFS